MDKDYLQKALQKFNDTNGVNWYGWKKEDDEGNKIPNSDRMQYKYVKIIKEGATMPSNENLRRLMRDQSSLPSRALAIR